MKKIAILLSALCCCIANAQDVIVLKNADEISAKIKEVAPTTVKYVEWDAQDGPDHIINKQDIFFVKYQNGKKEVFSEIKTKRGFSSIVSGKSYINKIKFQGYGYVRLMYGDYNLFSSSADLSLGVRFYDYFYLGAEIEYLPIFMEDYPAYGSTPKWRFGTHDVFLGGHMKGYIPISEKLYPFIDFSLGGHWLAFGFGGIGLGLKIGAGVDYKRFSSGIGYEYIIDGHAGYVKFGVRF